MGSSSNSYVCCVCNKEKMCLGKNRKFQDVMSQPVVSTSINLKLEDALGVEVE